MDHTTKYLPGFDATHIENYFFRDAKVIAEIFVLTNSAIRDDVNAIQHSYEANDLCLVREAVHKIKPVFNIVGLLTLEKEVGKFYNLSLEAVSLDELRVEYLQLLPELHAALVLIDAQTKLLHGLAEKPVNYETLT